MTRRSAYMEAINRGDFTEGLVILTDIGVSCDEICHKVALFNLQPKREYMTGVGYELLHLMIGHADHPKMFEKNDSYSNGYLDVGDPDLDADL